MHEEPTLRPGKLGPGTRIGSYEIVSALGAGGMGEVWRARDTELQRDVAIKVVPHELADDEAVLRRFRREARMLAAVNHPHIATIHAVEEADAVRFIVMELLEGETLQARLERGALPMDEALEIARQTAEALEAAHDRGLVHRDLKPANVFLTTGSRVKVLDFGIAKDVAAKRGKDEVTRASTSLMMSGTLLGTAPYMSPEQTRGMSIDVRTDIWAFGCVLYEMLTGRRAFAGRHVSETMAAILKEEPDWSLLPPETPALVTSLLRRCLRKDPDRRLHHIADARIEIDEATAPDPREPDVLAAAASEDRAAPLWRNVALALGAVVLVLGGYLLGRTRTPAAPEVWNTRQITRGPAIESQASLDPAGQFIVYTSNEHGNLDIYWQLVEGENVQNLTDDSEADDLQPAISPDGSTIAFRSERSGGGL